MGVLKDSEALPSFQGSATAAGSVADLELSAEQSQAFAAAESAQKERFRSEKQVPLLISRSITGGLPLHVSINGCSLSIPVGVTISVPASVSLVVLPRIEAEGRDA